MELRNNEVYGTLEDLINLVETGEMDKYCNKEGVIEYKEICLNNEGNLISVRPLPTPKYF
jgi:hypothetical protein